MYKGLALATTTATIYNDGSGGEEEAVVSVSLGRRMWVRVSLLLVEKREGALQRW